MPTKADKLKSFMLAQIADKTPYVLGGEKPGKALDCSGTYHQGSIAAGFPIGDDTAAGYYSSMTPRKGSPKPGDCGFLKDHTGHVHHMCVALGDGTECEARSPHMTPNFQRRPVAEFAAQDGFAGWRYWPGHDFGELTNGGAHVTGDTSWAIVLEHAGNNSDNPAGLVRTAQKRGNAALSVQVPKAEPGHAQELLVSLGAVIHAFCYDPKKRAAIAAAIK